MDFTVYKFFSKIVLMYYRRAYEINQYWLDYMHTKPLELKQTKPGEDAKRE